MYNAGDAERAHGVAELDGGQVAGDVVEPGAHGGLDGEVEDFEEGVVRRWGEGGEGEVLGFEGGWGDVGVWTFGEGDACVWLGHFGNG